MKFLFVGSSPITVLKVLKSEVWTEISLKSLKVVGNSAEMKFVVKYSAPLPNFYTLKHDGTTGTFPLLEKSAPHWIVSLELTLTKTRNILIICLKAGYIQHIVTQIIISC